MIASTTRRLIGDRFEVGEVRKCSLKGINEPISAWPVHALRRTEDRFETAREALILTPLVGREDEMGCCWAPGAKHPRGLAELSC